MDTNKNKNQKKIPHKAVILLKAEIMELLPDGKVSGIPIKKISHSYILSNNSLQNCKEEVEKLIKQISQIIKEEYNHGTTS